jgi:hypothetical protein
MKAHGSIMGDGWSVRSGKAFPKMMMEEGDGAPEPPLLQAEKVEAPPVEEVESGGSSDDGDEVTDPDEPNVWLRLTVVIATLPFFVAWRGCVYMWTWTSDAARRWRADPAGGRWVAGLLGMPWVCFKLFAVAYAIRTVVLMCDSVGVCDGGDRFALGLAKAAAMMFVPTFGLAVISVARPTINLLETSSIVNFLPVASWRKVHVGLATGAFACGVLHAFAHFVRRVQSTPLILGSLWYETWELVTGVIIMVLFCGMAAQYAVLREPVTAGRFRSAAKRYFRLTHRPGAVLTCIVLCLHSWRMTPLFIIMFALGSYLFTRLVITDVHVRVLQGRRYVSTVSPSLPYVVELFFNTQNTVPQSFGHYVTVGVRSMSSPTSLTVIPTDEDGFMVQVAPSVLGEALVPIITPFLSKRGGSSYDRIAGSWKHDSARGTWHRIPPSSQPLTVSGFFNSFDRSFGNRRNLICFVRSTGRAVADAVLTFHDSYRTYDSVLIIHQSRRAYSHFTATTTSQSEGARTCIAEVSSAAAGLVDPSLTPLARHVVSHARAAHQVTEAGPAIHRSLASPSRVVVVNVAGAIEKPDVADMLDSLLVLDRTTHRSTTEILVVSTALARTVSSVFDDRPGDPRFDKSCLHIEAYGGDY